MPTYLERYRNGEYIQVWNELMAVDANVRQEPIYSDALAVARETMTRVRHNIELLVKRLHEIGYLFEQPARAFIPPSQTALENLLAFEREIGPVPLSIKACVEMVGRVDFSGTYPGLSYYAPSVTSDFATLFSSGLFESQAFQDQAQKLGFPPIPQAMLDLFKNNLAQEQQKPAARLSLQEIGVTHADPLCIAFDGLSADWYRNWQAVRTETGELDDDDPMALDVFTFHIAPDIDHKSNFSGAGGYDIALPNAAVDALLMYEAHQTSFVNYLRISFQWAGFPGLAHEDKRDNALLDKLRVGLLPI